MIKTAKNVPNGESPFLLIYTVPAGAHAVVGYGQEDGAWEFDGRQYNGRILTWDPNFPDALQEDACLYYHSDTFDCYVPAYNRPPRKLPHTACRYLSALCVVFLLTVRQHAFVGILAQH